MDLVERVHIFGLTSIHTFGPNVSPVRLFSLMLNHVKPRVVPQNGLLLVKKLYFRALQVAKIYVILMRSVLYF